MPQWYDFPQKIQKSLSAYVFRGTLIGIYRTLNAASSEFNAIKPRPVRGYIYKISNRTTGKIRFALLVSPLSGTGIPAIWQVECRVRDASAVPVQNPRGPQLTANDGIRSVARRTGFRRGVTVFRGGEE